MGLIDLLYLFLNINFKPFDINAYATCEGFFTRVYKPGSRYIFAEDNNSKAVYITDSRIIVYKTNYYRYYSPVFGTIKQFYSILSNYYKVDILTRNTRGYVLIKTKKFSDVLFVAIRASDIGIKLGAYIKKKSSIIIVFKPGRVKFNDDLLGASKQVSISLDTTTKG
ncbi:hypothetical protein B0J12DRAFT_714887 [Macrophomina phaseolina]|uniref:Uncharacterized protein n=1 Tax=Macrophomina phaseolina TaxID=35725 RepID=A0ABQ8FQ98_9PEZI|nr:hypothetical protein B0J12DRAFT_714887 [Macrophomina phaseolina]